MRRSGGPKRLALVLAIVLLGPAIPATTPSPVAAADPPSVSLVGDVTGQFFAAGWTDAAFYATPSSTAAFSESFPTINFNANNTVVPCSPASGVSEFSEPLTDVVPNADGSCTTVIAEGNGYQTGSGSLAAFDAVLTGTFSVSAAGDVTFGFYADDGFILGIGSGTGGQPYYVSGPLSAPPTTPFRGLQVVGADNNWRAYAYSPGVVHFPAAGTYPFELDYFDILGAPLAMTLTANGAPIQRLGGCVSLCPADGPWYGSNTITISGTGFVAGSTAVMFGGVAGTSVTVLSPTELTVTTPSLVHPYATAQYADVSVTTPAGTTTLANGYTYRGIAVIMLRGLGSSYAPGQSDPWTPGYVGGLASMLAANGVPTQAFLQFSYTGGWVLGGAWTPETYFCEDTYGPIASAPIGSPDPPVVVLDKMIRTYADTHPNVDVYLVGHSQGGVVAMAYAAYLRHNGDSTSAIRGATTANQVRLAGVVTLDSPIGGLNGGLALFAKVTCPSAWGLQPLAASVLDFMKLWKTTAQGTPLGGVAQTGTALLSDPSLGSNDTITRGMQGDPEAPAFLTVGNTMDHSWATSLPPSPNPLTTQWLTNGSLSAQHVYAGAIKDALPGTDWIGVVLRRDVGALANHERVMRSTDVAASVWQLLKGLPPAIAGVFPSRAVQAAPASALAAATPANAIIGTVTGAGGTPLVGLDVAAISTTSWAATMATTTAADGTYLLPVDPGTYLVAFHDPGGAYAPGYAGTSGFTTDVAAAQNVTVGTADVTVDVALIVSHGVTGTVTAAGGGPLAGVRVDAQDAGGTFVTGAVTAADGTYGLMLADGTYLIHVNGAGVQASGYYATGGFVSTLAAGTPVAVVGAPIAGINIAMPAIAHLSGVVTDGSSAPLANILVTAAAVVGGVDAVAYTAADGSYSMAVDAGTYTVSFEDPTGRYASGYAGAAGYVPDPGSARQLVVALADVADISVSLPGLPELTLTKTHAGDFTQGQVGATYTFTATNGGAAATSGTVSVVDTLPAGLTATAMSGTGWSCTLATLTCTRTDSLAASASYPAITLTVTVAADAPTSLTNTAVVSGGGETNTANDAASDPTTIRGATYVSLTPARLLDTRVGTGLSGTFSSGTARTLTVAGQGGVPSNAIAVTGNLTVTNQTSAGFVALTPSPTNSPTTSTLNFPVGDNRANGVTVALSGTGTLSATYMGAAGPSATTDLIFDVTGYFVPTSAGATYVSLTPARLLDTRVGTGLSGTFSSGTARTLTVAGQGGVPSNAIAVTGNLTVTNQTSAGFVALTPSPTNSPTTSTLNFPVGDNRANGVTVALSGTGTLSATYMGAAGPSATTDLIFDVTGYFVPTSAGATYVSLTPARLLDTRVGTGLSGTFSSGTARTLTVAGQGGVPSNAIAVTGNLTVTNQTSAGFVALTPSPTNSPTTSTLNFPVGDNRANGVTVALSGTGTLSATYMGAAGPSATTDLIFDVTGYFVP